MKSTSAILNKKSLQTIVGRQQGVGVPCELADRSNSTPRLASMHGRKKSVILVTRKAGRDADDESVVSTTNEQNNNKTCGSCRSVVVKHTERIRRRRLRITLTAPRKQAVYRDRSTESGLLERI